MKYAKKFWIYYFWTFCDVRKSHQLWILSTQPASLNHHTNKADMTANKIVAIKIAPKTNLNKLLFSFVTIFVPNMKRLQFKIVQSDA